MNEKDEILEQQIEQDEEVEKEEVQEDGSTAEPRQEEVEEKSKTFTQEEVNEIVNKRLERNSNSIYNRYGVKNRDELDDIITKSKSYDEMKELFDNQEKELNDLKQKMAFINNNIKAEREEDVKVYFKGKELELTEENLKNELSSHPEWLKDTKTIESFGVEHKQHKTEETSAEKRKRIFGI